jgi:hypothetical protein
MTFNNQFDLSDYQSVQDRIEIFWKNFPNGRIINELVLTNEKECIIKCSVWKDGTGVLPDAVDYAQETISEKGVNKYSALENCATSATGRAISLLGGELSPSKKRASQTEMLKAARQRDWMFEAKKMVTAENISGLRKLYEEAKTLNMSDQLCENILVMGKQLAEKLNAPESQETGLTGASVEETTEQQS